MYMDLSTKNHVKIRYLGAYQPSSMDQKTIYEMQTYSKISMAYTSCTSNVPIRSRQTNR